MPATLSVAPSGFWLKTHFYREGNLLHVVAYSCVAGSPEVFNFSVDLRPIMAKLMKVHLALHKTPLAMQKVKDPRFSGFFDDAFSSIKHAVSSPGQALKSVAQLAVSPVSVMNRALETIPGVSAARSAIMNKISPGMNDAYSAMLGASTLKLSKAALVSQVSSAIKGAAKYQAGNLLHGVSVAMPSVSLPALNAFNEASKHLSAIDQASAAMSAAKRIASGVPNAAALKAELMKWAGSTVKDATAQGVSLVGNSILAQAMKLTSDRSKEAKKILSLIAEEAKKGDVNAQRMARVVHLAHNSRRQMKAIHGATHKNLHRIKGHAPVPSNLNGFPALLIHSSGHIIPGRYIEKKGAPAATILRKGKVLRGHFAKVAGEMGLGNDAVGCIGSASSNPFLGKPGHLR